MRNLMYYFLELMDFREPFFFILYLWILLKNKIIESYDNYKKIKYD